jgi:hypothetical protein
VLELYNYNDGCENKVYILAFYELFAHEVWPQKNIDRPLMLILFFFW